MQSCILKLADSSLSPAEREDKEIERLINKKSAPSRKQREKRAPNHSTRRKRMKDHTEKREDDKDLSRSTKASLLCIAARIAADPTIEQIDAGWDEPAKGDDTLHSVEEYTGKPTTKEERLHTPPKNTIDEGKDLIVRVISEFEVLSKKLAESFKEFAKKEYYPIFSGDFKDPEKQAYVVKRLRKLIRYFNDEASKVDVNGSNPTEISNKIVKAWPKDTKSWAGRAGVIVAVQKLIKKIHIPEIIKTIIITRPENIKKNTKLIKEAIKKTCHKKDINEKDLGRLATLAAANRVLVENPDTLDVKKFTKDVDEFVGQIRGYLEEIFIIPKLMQSISEMKSEKLLQFGKDKPSALTFFGEVENNMKSLFKRGNKALFDQDTFVNELEEVAEDELESVPKEFKNMLDKYKSRAASYDVSRSKAMGQKTATYHGVLQQGDPTHGPYTGYKSYDRRYFGKENYDSIVASAKKILDEDWLKYSWDDGAKDANFRAALDLAIWTTDSNLYQSKIDTETYNMLLANVMGIKDDTFSETVITNDDSSKTRRAFSMSNQYYQNILRVASELRKTDPKTSFNLVKNLRHLVAQQQEEEQEQQEKIGQEQQEHTEHCSQQEQQSADKDAAVPDEVVKKLQKAFDDAKRAVKDTDDWKKSLEKIMEIMEPAMAAAGAPETEKIASAVFPVTTLIKLAFSNPGARPVLLAMIREAAKKKNKGKGKSKPKAEPKEEPKEEPKGKKAPLPFGGKKAPPFTGKKTPAKTSGKGKKKKASIDFDQLDTSW